MLNLDVNSSMKSMDFRRLQMFDLVGYEKSDLFQTAIHTKSVRFQFLLETFKVDGKNEF